MCLYRVVQPSPHQGMPLLICIATALMDQFGSCDLTLPDMGVAQCFLGSPWGEQWISSSSETSAGEWTAFFSSPEFLYFHSILITLQAANVLFFLLTVYYLVDHWRNSAGIIKSETRGNFLIVLKLFFIMGKCQCMQCRLLRKNHVQVFHGWESLYPIS